MLGRKVVIRLAVLLALAVAADRISVAVVDGVVASQLKKVGRLSADPSVSVRGFPFLTQALAGRFDEVAVTVPSLDAGDVRLRNLQLVVRGARVPLRDALSGSVGAVAVDGISGSAQLPYADLAALSTVKDLTVVPAGDGVMLRGTVLVAGRSVKGSALASAELSHDVLVVRSRSVTTDVPTSAAIRAQVGALLDLRVRLGGLPFGLHVVDATAGPTGLRLTAKVGRTVLRALPPPPGLSPLHRWGTVPAT